MRVVEVLITNLCDVSHRVKLQGFTLFVVGDNGYSSPFLCCENFESHIFCRPPHVLLPTAIITSDDRPTISRRPPHNLLTTAKRCAEGIFITIIPYTCSHYTVRLQPYGWSLSPLIAPCSLPPFYLSHRPQLKLSFHHNPLIFIMIGRTTDQRQHLNASHRVVRRYKSNKKNWDLQEKQTKSFGFMRYLKTIRIFIFLSSFVYHHEY